MHGETEKLNKKEILVIYSQYYIYEIISKTTDSGGGAL
jgi:hypothetical protein